MQEFNKYVMYSGGAYGSDYIWGTEALNYGILEEKIFHYYIKGNQTPFGNQPIILNEKIIKKIDDDLKIVNEKFLNRTFPTKKAYVDNLLRRNWFQVQNTKGVYAICELNDGMVLGGTAWAVYLAILKKLTVLVFDQKNKKWHYWDYKQNKFVSSEKTPYLFNPFTGIGTRNINSYGKKAIKEVFEKTKELIYKKNHENNYR